MIVRFLARKAKKLARKWGGQCIVFIDEIDAVGMRRQSLGGGLAGMQPRSFHDLCFFGPNGALNPSEDLVLESRAWRERVFAERQPSVAFTEPFVGRVVNAVFPGMHTKWWGARDRPWAAIWLRRREEVARRPRATSVIRSHS